MILSEEYLRELLAQTEQRVHIPAEHAVVLEGSIAEGFGNSSSDIDFLVIADDDHDYPTMPSILFVDGHRVEVRTRSLRQIHQQAEELRSTAARGARATAAITVGLLDRCQRLAGSYPLRNNDLVDRAKQPLPTADVAPIVSRWYATHARNAARLGVALAALHQDDEARNWAQLAVLDAAKSWAAAQGECYVESKWLPRQLARIGAAAATPERRWRELTGPAPLPPRPAFEFVADCVALVTDLGVDGVRADPDLVSPARRRAVTSWQLGDRVHVVRDRRDVFVLRDDAAAVWRRIVFGRPLPALLGDDAAHVGALVAEFHRIGLIDLAWHRGGVISSAQPWAPDTPSTPPPSTVLPLLGLRGAVAESGVDDQRPVTLLAVPADRFSAAGMAHVWSNIMVENAREDLEGALDHEQWQVAQVTAKRMLSHACRALLSAYGVAPLPPDSGIVPRLASLPAIPEQLAKHAATLAQQLAVESATAGAELLDGLNLFVRCVREGTGAQLFPASFASGAQWEDTLQIGHDWVRLGAYLDADFPIEESRDLFATGGAQPHLIGGG